jgi:hypothetical protein
MDNYGLFTAFTVGRTTSEVVDPTASRVWAYWISGGSEFVTYGDNGSFSFVVPDDRWIVSPASPSNRWIVHGSQDGWTLAEYSWPGTNPTAFFTDINGVEQPVTVGTYSGIPPGAIPESSGFVLITLGGFTIFIVRRFLKRLPS